MHVIGIICEYNPFHNGHLYHLKKIKELYNDSLIILVTNSYFTERGDISIMTKYEKTLISLQYGIDLIVELPFVFGSQSADLFASGSIQILKELKADTIVFGSETNNIKVLEKLNKLQESKEYQNLVKNYLDKGINYPTALSKALYELSNIKIDKPNDLLGLSYIKAIHNLNANITPISIQRTNNYHDLSIDNEIISGSAIRKLIKENKDITKYVPKQIINFNLQYIDLNNYYDLLKYKIITEKEKINNYQTVDEGIESRILKYIDSCTTLDELIDKVKTKRYTYNKLKRMFTHILCSFTKEEAKNNKNIEYIRLLGFNNNGRKYLNKVKKSLSISIISKLSNNNSKQLEIEKRITNIYKLKNNKTINEYKDFPIYYK